MTDPRREELKKRIMDHSVPEPNTGCWLWTMSTDRDGYGSTKLGQKSWRANRLSYFLFKGEMGDRLVCHKCDTPQCVNPDHLYLGTNRDNNIDAVIRRRHHKVANTHCPSGHAFTPENTTITKSGFGGWRRCKTCDKAHWKQANRKRLLKEKSSKAVPKKHT